MKLKINSGNALMQKKDSSLFCLYVIAEPQTENKIKFSLWVRGGRLWMGTPNASIPYPYLVREAINGLKKIKLKNESSNQISG